ncbi:MAG TPA: molybdopterin-dependent oxidoreductase [Thermodesulfobacteriota bacterium]|nr:molybdopterin-dependent oxidoreductase [Thermodesulfobacteriota bacterium]
MSILKDLGVPAFKAGGMPAIDLKNYSLSVGGLVKEEKHFSWQEISAMPRSCVNCRLTSVSGWSVRADWEGVQWNDLLRLIHIKSKASYVRFTSAGGGYTTSVSLKDLENPRVLLAYGVNGSPIEPEYGGPLRMVIPNLWGYKSCKWLSVIEFVREEEGGYWEDRGYTWSGMIEPGFTLDINTKTRRPIKGGEITEF